MTRRYLPLAALLFVAAFLPPHLQGQAEESLRQRIETELFAFGDCGLPLCLDLSTLHGDHFIPALSDGNEAVISFVTDAIGEATLSVPLGATSSGATFSVVGGVPVRTSTSAGPIFGERTQTLGRGRFFLGASVTGVDFTSLNGVPLDGLQLNFQHIDADPAGTYGDPVFENDLMAMDLAIDVSVLVGTVAATVGVTDFMDLSVAVPFVRTTVRGESQAQVLPFGDNAVHRFGGDLADPVLLATSSMSGSASGIGDVAGRLKINFGQSATMGAGFLAELRLPTGDEENLLGAGATQFRAMALYSAQIGTFSPHLNVGYAARTGETQNDGVVIQAAFDNLLTDWATLAVGVESEVRVGERKVTLPSPIQLDLPYVRQFPATNIPNSDGDLLRASVGAKFIVRGGTVLVLNGIFPLREVALQPDFIWTAGLDFPF